MEAEINEIELFRQAEKNKTYFDNNFKDLENKYPEKFIAISGANLVGVMDNVDALIDLVESKGIERSNVLIEFIPSPGSILVL